MVGGHTFSCAAAAAHFTRFQLLGLLPLWLINWNSQHSLLLNLSDHQLRIHTKMHLHGSIASGSPATSDSLSSHRDVTYSCGSCGYALNLSSSNRNTTNIGAEYGKAIKKGVVSFFSIDETRFSQADELACLPNFTSNRSCGLFRRRTRLTCRKCGSFIGSAYELGSGNGAGAGACKRYDIRIGALQPSFDESGTPLVT